MSKRSRENSGSGGKKKRTASYIGSRKRSHPDDQQTPRKAQFIQHAVPSRIVNMPHRDSAIEKHRKAFASRSERRRGIRLRISEIKLRIARAQESYAHARQRQRQTQDERQCTIIETDLQFYEGQIKDLKRSLDSFLKENADIEANVSSEEPIVHTLEDHAEIQEWLETLNRIVAQKQLTLRDTGELRHVIRILQNYQRKMNLSSHQSQRYGKMLAEIQRKGWHVPRYNSSGMQKLAI
jgi:hypothetical protein